MSDNGPINPRPHPHPSPGITRRLIVGVLVALLALAGLSTGSVAQAKPFHPKADQLTPADLPKVAGKVGGETPARDKALSTALKGRMPSKSDPAPRSYPATACGTSCYRYAGTVDDFSTDPVDGFQVDMTVGNPYLARTTNNNVGQNDAHTLIEIAAINTNAGAGTENRVEVGAIKSGSVCGQATDPCLFVYMAINGVGQGYNSAAAAGFVDLSGTAGYSPIGPGDSLASHVGTSKSFRAQYFDNASSSNREGWWIVYDNLFVGYYPIAKWTGAGQTFVEADQPQFFAELAGLSAIGSLYESCSDMGTGAMAGTSPSTVITNYLTFGTTEAKDMAWFPNATVPARWGLTTVGTPVTTIRVGGPGHSTGEPDALGYRDTCGPAAQGTPAASSIQFWQEIAPDNSSGVGGTGATNMVNYTYTSTPVGTCFVPLNQGIRPIRAVWNNSGSSGKTFQVFKTNNCSGTAKTYGNAAKEAFPAGSGWEGFNIGSFKRTA